MKDYEFSITIIIRAKDEVQANLLLEDSINCAYSIQEVQQITKSDE